MSYESVVLADSPTFLWLLNETTGTTAADATGNGNTGTYSGGYTQAAAGPLFQADATTFNGTTGFVYLNGEISTGASPDVFSVECWFKTAAAGPIGGLSQAQALGNGTYDRMLYVNTSDQLAFYIYQGTAFTDPASTATVTGGGWHYAVVTYSDVTGNIFLYLDGSQVATASGKTTPANYGGYWLAGGDTGGTTFNGGNAGSNNGLTGTMAAFAIYPAVLTGTQVTNHWSASGYGATFTAPPNRPRGQAVNRASTY